MKIGAIQAAGMSNYKAAKIQPAKKESLSMGSDRLEISESSRLFSDALKVAMQAPSVRADKVAAIQSQVTTGAYSVNSAVIADKILRGVSRAED
jgi:negative regulator of flagellin synthesis FlgM